MTNTSGLLALFRP